MKNVSLYSTHPILAAGFATILAQSGEFNPSVCSNLSHLADHSGSYPDIVLVDLASGLSISQLSELRSVAAPAAIVLWVDNISTEFAAQAIKLGVLGILRKDASIQVHMDCLRSVAAGELSLENELNQKLLCNKEIKLAPRERQLATLLAQGLKNKEIGYRLGITEGTVKVYLSRLYEKVGAGDRFELALFVLKNLGTDQALLAHQPAGTSGAAGSKASFLPGFMSIERLPVGVH
jgi:DNA-binding NarL/FixJ family response regulator